MNKEQQWKLLRQKELDNLKTSINGKEYTRKQLVAEIALIQEKDIDRLEKEIEARNRLVQAHEDANTKALSNVEINKMTASEWELIKNAATTLNEAYDTQVIDINKIATSVSGVSGAWDAVTTAIKNASLELGKYPLSGSEKFAIDKAAADKAAADKIAADKIAADKIAADKKAAEDAAKAGTGAETVDPNSARGRLNAYLKSKADKLEAAEEKRRLEAEAAKLATSEAALRKLQSGQVLTAIERKLLGIGMAKGGFVPQYMANGGFSIGTDTVPAMLTPGEFVVRKSVADQYGPLLESLNSGKYKSFEAPTYSPMINDAVSVGAGSASSVSDNSSKVYNYNVGISVNNTSASADDIAKVVMAEIKYIDSQRLRGQR